jgi:hypothetical protein
MTYNPAIPAANDIISQSQSQIQTNFSQADTAFAVNHTAFSVGANQGFHKKVTLTAPIADPGAAAPITTVYSKTVGARTELYYQNDSGASAASIISSMRAFGVFVPQVGPTIVDGFNFASITRNSTGNYTVSFTRTLPTTNYGVVALGGMATNFNTGAIIGTTNYLVGSFQILLRSMSAPSGVDDALPISFWVFQSGN